MAAKLTRWVNDEILTLQAFMTLRKQFQTDKFKSVVIDSFIHPDRIRILQQCFDTDAHFSTHHGLIKLRTSSDEVGEQAVSEAAFNEAALEERLAREQIMSGPSPGRQKSAGWQANLSFTRLLASKEFAAFLTELTGIDRLQRMSYMPRTMLYGDFCRAHSDAGGQRRLCMLLYVDAGWKEGFGGRFQQLEKGAVKRSIAPHANRVILHKPDRDLIHQVEPISHDGRAWRRQTYSIWFSAVS